MRPRQVAAVDPDRFLKAFEAGNNVVEKLPESDGVNIRLSDGSVRNYRPTDTPEMRAIYTLMQAVPDADHPETWAIIQRIHALRAIAKHPALAEFIKFSDGHPMIHHKVIYAAARCPLRSVFLPAQLLRTIRSESEPESIVRTTE
jgi:hypothetical protein